MPRRRTREDGPPPQDGDARPWVWIPGRTFHDPQFGEETTDGRWSRRPADPQDPPVPRIDD